MYAKCGMLARARNLLDELALRNTVSWNVLIAEYAQREQGQKAEECYRQMQRDGVPPDAVTLACMLKVYGYMGRIKDGKEIHDESRRRGLVDGSVVLASALVDMYAKCGAVEKAQEIFDELVDVQNVVSWTALIAGYVQQEKGEEALRCLVQMRNRGICGDMVTFACILKACGSVGMVDKGQQIHNEMINRFGDSLHKNVVLGTALVDMYAKCGMLEKARNVLDRQLLLDVALWNALIMGYSQQGQSVEALKCFKEMLWKGLSPDEVTFISVLNACSLSGLLHEAEQHFSSMTSKYGVKPNWHHYTCMVSSFARIGCFDKAMEMIKKMPSCDYLPLWHALLSACSKWGNVELGKLAFENALKIDINDALAYALMETIYAQASMKENVKIVASK
jgi:pentatricopeptide repeat protein